jgi:CO/xanthine dehydrogenase Mo-binding subunit
MRDGHEPIGYGMAACNWDAYRTPAKARVQLRSDGTASVTCAIQDIGTGTYTIAAQVVGEVTGLPVERIEVKQGIAYTIQNIAGLQKSESVIVGLGWIQTMSALIIAWLIFAAEVPESSA